MSIDPVTPALCKKPKSIHLGDYSVGGGQTVNDVVLDSVATGGGVVTFDSGCEKLWKDIIDKQPTHLVMYVGCNVRITINMYCAGENISSSDWFISGTGAMSYYGMNMRVTVILAGTEDGKGVVVSTLNEPIQFPS